MIRSLAAVAGVVLVAAVLAAPVPMVKKNQWAFTSDGHIYLFTEGDKEPKKPTDGQSRNENPAWSPDGKRIAFSSTRDSESHIFVMDADGKNVKRITHGKQNHYAPNWSPDGRTIAFCREGTKNSECCTANAADGRDIQVLSDSEDFNPVFSPDGQSIAFVTSRDNVGYLLYTMTADGKKPTALVTDYLFGAGVMPAWSPDGKQIAFSLHTDDGLEIHVVKPDGTGLKPIMTFGEKKRATSPSWSSDGTKIAFVCDEQGRGKGQTALWVMDADGRNQKEVMKLAEIPIYTVAWRPK